MSKPPESPSPRVTASTPRERDTTRRPLGPGADVEETAKLVAEFATELSSLARHSRLELLAYLLDMARLEAIRVVQSQHRSP